MARLQDTLNALKPYVVGIRYVESIPVVDAVFKNGWTIPDSNVINKTKGDEGLNYYMLHSEKEGIGVDELLDFVAATIQANVERENKHQLLKETVDKLKVIFQNTPLSKLKQLKFTFESDELLPEIDEFKLEDIVPSQPTLVEPVVTATNEETINTQELSDEELEILEEERRGQRNIELLKQKNGQKSVVNGLAAKIELPPRQSKKVEVSVETLETPDCECGPEEACNKCIGVKGY